MKSQQSLEIKYSHKPRNLGLSHQWGLWHPECSHHNPLLSTAVLSALAMYSESFSVFCLNFKNWLELSKYFKHLASAEINSCLALIAHTFFFINGLKFVTVGYKYEGCTICVVFKAKWRTKTVCNSYMSYAQTVVRLGISWSLDLLFCNVYYMHILPPPS